MAGALGFGRAITILLIVSLIIWALISGYIWVAGVVFAFWILFGGKR